MSGFGQEFHLWIESRDLAAPGSKPVDHGQNGARAPRVLSVPQGPSVLSMGHAGQPQLCEAARGGPDGKLLLEPWTNRTRQLRLVLVNRTAHVLRVNGQPAPRIAVLREADVFQLAGTVVFHVSLFSRPSIGPPSAQLVGKECPICRVPFSADTKCYVCACGTAIHCEDSTDGLQCAHLRTDCPACHRPIVMEEGYSYVPEFDE